MFILALLISNLRLCVESAFCCLFFGVEFFKCLTDY